MIEKIKENRWMILLLLTGAVYFFLKYISPLIAPVLVAALMVFACIPFFDRIRKKIRFPRMLLMSFFLFTIILFLGILLWFLVTKCTDCIMNVMQNLETIESKFSLFVKNCCDGMETRFGINADRMETAIIERVNIFIQDFQMNILPGVVNESLSYAKYVVSIGAFLAVTAISVFLLVKDYDRIMGSIKKRENSLWILEIVEQVIYYIATFVKAQLVILLCISLVCAAALTLAGVENGVVYGLLAGFLDMLPFIGTGIILIPLGIWQLLNGWYVQTVVCFILYGVCVIMREFLEPKLIGKKVGIYPIAILLSVYAGVKLFGLGGILKGPLGLVMIYQGLNGWEERIRRQKETSQ